MNIDIINVDDSLAALALRSSLEYWGCTVALHLIGSSQHLVRVLSGETKLSKHVVLMGHGTQQGLVLPELGADIQAQQPYPRFISPAHFQEFLKLPECLFINAGCLMGKKEYATVFLEAGCHSYIGPVDYPEGTSSQFYLLHFFYEFHVKNNGVEIAHQKAIAHDAETRMYELYRHER